MELTKEQALKLFDSKWWEGMPARDIVRFQLFTPRLCMPFDLFHKAVEEALGRPVWTHEFAFDGIKKEFLGQTKAPTFDEIIGLIPKEKLILVGI